MNREILFRTWNPLHNTMEKNFDIDSYGNIGIINMFETYEQKSDWVLMQFTGLHDKNGKAIFEGDVVRILYTDWPSNTDPNIELEDYMKSISSIGAVKYNVNAFEIEFFGGRYNDYYFGSIFPGTHGRIEVIGDIFSNPELLNK